MATASNNREAVRTIRRQLNGLRRKLSTWIFVRGLGRWLLVILGVFAVDMCMDRVFRLDFAQRAIMLVLMLLVFTAYLFFKLVRPLCFKVTDEKLLMQVENQNAQSGQSIISSYELAQDDAIEEKGLSQQLTDATIQQGIKNAKEITFGSALDGGQAGKNWLLLLVGAVGTAVLGVGVWFGTQMLGETKTEVTNSTLVSNDVESVDAETVDAETVDAESDEVRESGIASESAKFLGIWFNRNVLLGDAQWPQSTYLEIVGVENGEVVAARGSSYQQVVRVLAKSKVKDVEIDLEVDGPNGRTFYPMKLFGDSKHRFIFNNVSSEMRFRAVGGDAETEWVKMVLVEAPAVKSSTMEVIWPSYTGLKESKLEGAGPHILLPGAKVKIAIESNKPLSECALKIDDNLTNMEGSGTEFTTTLGVDSPLLGGKYDFELSDLRGLKNNRTASFTLKLREDKAPKVRAELVGIGGLVVPTATVPTRFSAIDDYGLRAIEFNCGWKEDSDNQEPAIRKFSVLKVEKGAIRLEYDAQESLELESLKLEPGIGLRFVVAATDTNPDPPGISKSREFLLRVVTEEELRGDLLRREIEQRKAFKQAYDAQMAAIAEIRGIAGMRQASGVTTEEFQTEQSRRLLSAYRAQKLIGTNVDAVRQRFDEFVLEVRNNKLDSDPDMPREKTLEYRFGTTIAGRIRDIDAGGLIIKDSEGQEVAKPDFISLAALNLEDCRHNLSDRAKLNESVEKTTQTQEKILDIMREVLDAMEDSELFQSAINDLLEIKRIEKDIRDALKGNGGEAPGGIFEEEENKIFEKD